jgi:hypothetical protein
MALSIAMRLELEYHVTSSNPLPIHTQKQAFGCSRRRDNGKLHTRFEATGVQLAEALTTDLHRKA